MLSNSCQLEKPLIGERDRPCSRSPSTMELLMVDGASLVVSFSYGVIWVLVEIG